MKNPYLPPQSKESRVYKTPLIVPLSSLGVIVVFVGYAFFDIVNSDVGVLEGLKKVSFGVFLACAISMLFLTLYNGNKLASFLGNHPKIDSRESLEIIKPIIRTNMYSSLFNILSLFLGALTAIMTIMNHGALKGWIVTALIISLALLMNLWYSPLEKKIKHIESDGEELEQELDLILKCWLHKAFPNF